MPKNTKIRCPKCDTEYLACEIFYPKNLVGTATNIVKSDAGDILGFNGSDMNPEETYKCDNCGQEFKVYASVSFKVSPVVDIFSDD